MTKRISYIYIRYTLLILIALSFTGSTIIFAQEGAQGLEFNKKVHNFGRISIQSGAHSCTFEFKNVSRKPIAINNVLSSCGCTTPEWPKKPIMPGQSGVIKVTFLNDQGPYPFDKALTVYTSAATKPIILRVTGVPYENNKSIKDQFPIAMGPLGIRNNTLKMGQLEQGESNTKTVAVANLSNKPVIVKFADISAGLSLKAEPATIPANGMGEITYTVDTKAKQNWGNTIYKANVVCNNVKASTGLRVDCMIIDNFSNLSKQEQNNGPMILAKNSSYNFGTVAKGEDITAAFGLRNTGYRELHIYKIDTSDSKLNINYPSTVKAGEEFTVKVSLNTAGYAGEEVFTITLITNSPNRPLVNLFVTGKIN